jgi:hypothetical protein
MTATDFLASLNTTDIDAAVVDRVEATYSATLPEQLKQIVSLAKGGHFFDGPRLCRLLSLEEIVSAEQELHVAFKAKGLLPLFDTGDNNFVVFNCRTNTWAKFNIVDETVYGSKPTLDALLR